MYIHPEKTYSDFFNSIVPWQNNDVTKFIFKIVCNDFAEEFNTYMSIDQTKVKTQFPYLVGLVTGAIWGKEFFNTSYKIHDSLLSYNCEILYSEQQHALKLLRYLFQTITQAFEISPKRQGENVDFLLQINYIGSIIEDFRKIHMETDNEVINARISTWAKKINSMRPKENHLLLNSA